MKTWHLLDRHSYFGLTRKSLQTLYLVAATGLAALVPLIFFAGYWMQSELGRSQRDLDVFLGARALSLSQRVDGDIDRQLTALHALAALPSLDQDVVMFESAARRVTAAMPHWSILSLADADGRLILTTGASDPVIDPALAKSAASLKRSLIETAVEGDGGSVLLYEPIVREGKATYVFVLNFGAEDIRTALAQSSAQDLFSVLMDRSGRVLARSDDPGTGELDPELRQAMGEEPAGLFHFQPSQGEAQTVAFTRSALTGWTSLVSISRNRSEHLFTRPVWATIGAGTLSLLLAGILAVFVTHNYMERRVSDERLAASRALGDLDARLLATSQDALDEQRKSASEREVLLREIYHRVKNNLQIVQSLLRLGSRDLTPDQREPFENAVRRIGAMSRVHTLLYNSPDLASIDFKDYLDELLKELSEGFSAEDRAIESVLNAAPMQMPLDTAVPLAFIAVEILTNSFKHAFPDGRSGRITVEVSRDGETAVLKIEDNGVGLGSDATTKRRLGLTIVRKLVQQIGGEIEEPPPGSSIFVIRFPINGVPTASAPPPPVPAVAS